MSPFKVPDGPFTIESVMETIRTQIVDADKESGQSAPASNAFVDDGSPYQRIARQLDTLQQRIDLETGYRIHSHRPLLGRLIDPFKRIIHWGARPYTDAIRTRQIEANHAIFDALQEIRITLETLARRASETADLLAETERTRREIEQRIESRISSVDSFARGIESEVKDLGSNLNDLNARAKVRFDDHAARLDRFDQRHDLSPLHSSIDAEERLHVLDITRGTFEDIAERQRHYAGLFTGAPGHVLDIGCGRGEMLDLLRHKGIECWGADLDPLMIELCEARGATARLMDAIAALESVPDGSLGGIFAAQVVEHLFPGDVVRLLQLARRKLAPRGRILIETINAGSPGAVAKSYWRDLDHKQAIHPEYMKLLLKMAGFKWVELTLLAPFRSEESIEPLPDAHELGIPPEARNALQARLDRLSLWIGGMQDYYVSAIQSDFPSPDGTAAVSDS